MEKKAQDKKRFYIEATKSEMDLIESISEMMGMDKSKALETLLAQVDFSSTKGVTNRKVKKG